MIKIFFDASVLFSAIYSPTGGSAQVCELIKSGDIKGYISKTVIDELQSNIKKLSRKTAVLPENFIIENKFIVRSEISEREIKPYNKMVDTKDAHVLAGAVLCRCDYLLTLDKKHINNENTKEKFTESIITSPKEFLEYFRTMYS